ncbi:MAG: MaoC family dehydratase [Verrucomicrobia bacterium]|nr:MaoC family dehydratase [Prolixibacteraceae bacterium]
MGKLIVRSHEDFENLVGQELGVSEFLTITQEQINKFADATFDHQWIHVDDQRAKTEGAFGSTIAHGYLTLSLLPYMWDQIIQVENIKMLVNYGIESFRFSQPVLVNSKIRTRVKLNSVSNLRGISKIKLDIAMEIEGNRKPAFEGNITFLYHFV